MPEVDDYIKRADAFMKMEDWDSAEEQIEKAIKTDPSNWRVWYAMIRCVTSDLKDVQAYGCHIEYLEKAKTVASESDYAELLKLCDPYKQKFRKANQERLSKAEKIMPSHKIKKPITELEKERDKIKTFVKICFIIGGLFGIGGLVSFGVLGLILAIAIVGSGIISLLFYIKTKN